jgi:UDP-N-acetyl-D-galactosamine dehydrogenase
LEAAGSKWNFLPYKPGLVGGHCIGVDPYYLTYKADSLGYYPQVILAGRRINDNMGIHIANRVVKLMTQNDLPVKNAKILVLGITFKENCPDIRNSRAIDLIQELQSFGADVEVYDPHASIDEVKHEYGLALINKPDKKYSAIVLAVSHHEFKNLDWKMIRNDKTIVYDVKGFLDPSQISSRL